MRIEANNGTPYQCCGGPLDGEWIMVPDHLPNYAIAFQDNGQVRNIVYEREHRIADDPRTGVHLERDFLVYGDAGRMGAHDRLMLELRRAMDAREEGREWKPWHQDNAKIIERLFRHSKEDK